MWHKNAQAQRDAARNPEVKCMTCGYHYRARTGRMIAGPEGWTCADLVRCHHNQAEQAKYRRTPA